MMLLQEAMLGAAEEVLGEKAKQREVSRREWHDKERHRWHKLLTWVRGITEDSRVWSQPRGDCRLMRYLGLARILQSPMPPEVKNKECEGWILEKVRLHRKAEHAAGVRKAKGQCRALERACRKENSCSEVFKVLHAMQHKQNPTSKMAAVFPDNDKTQEPLVGANEVRGEVRGLE